MTKDAVMELAPHLAFSHARIGQCEAIPEAQGLVETRECLRQVGVRALYFHQLEVVDAFRKSEDDPGAESGILEARRAPALEGLDLRKELGALLRTRCWTKRCLPVEQMQPSLCSSKLKILSREGRKQWVNARLVFLRGDLAIGPQKRQYFPAHEVGLEPEKICLLEYPPRQGLDFTLDPKE